MVKNTTIENRLRSTLHGEAEPIRAAKIPAAVRAEITLVQNPIVVATLSERSIPISPSRLGKGERLAVISVRIAGVSKIASMTSENFFVVHPVIHEDFEESITSA